MRPRNSGRLIDASVPVKRARASATAALSRGDHPVISFWPPLARSKNIPSSPMSFSLSCHTSSTGRDRDRQFPSLARYTGKSCRIEECEASIQRGGTLQRYDCRRRRLPGWLRSRHRFFDTPIGGFSDKGKLPQARYNGHTGDTMVKLGEWLGMSPKKLKHIFDGYTGTMGMYALSAMDVATPLAPMGLPSLKPV